MQLVLVEISSCERRKQSATEVISVY